MEWSFVPSSHANSKQVGSVLVVCAGVVAMMVGIRYSYKYENHPSNEPNKIENQNQANPLFNLSLKVLKDYMVFLVGFGLLA